MVYHTRYQTELTNLLLELTWTWPISWLKLCYSVIVQMRYDCLLLCIDYCSPSLGVAAVDEVFRLPKLQKSCRTLCFSTTTPSGACSLIVAVTVCVSALQSQTLSELSLELAFFSPARLLLLPQCVLIECNLCCSRPAVAQYQQLCTSNLIWNLKVKALPLHAHTRGAVMYR